MASLRSRFDGKYLHGESAVNVSKSASSFHTVNKTNLEHLNTVAESLVFSLCRLYEPVTVDYIS